MLSNFLNHFTKFKFLSKFLTLCLAIFLIIISIFRFNSTKNTTLPEIENNDEIKTEDFNKADLFCICDTAIKKHYSKLFPPYEEIEIFDGNKKIKWQELSWEEKLNKIEEGAHGDFKEKVKNTKKEWQDFLKTPRKKEEKEKFLQPKIKDLIGANDGRGKLSQCHGAQHSIETAIIALSIAKSYKTLYKEFQNISPKEMKLIFVSGAYHDSARQADGIDIFDSLSAQNAYEDSIKHFGLNKEEAHRVKMAINNKDIQDKNKDIISVCLHEADCFEMLRFSEAHFDLDHLNAKSKIDKQALLTPKQGISSDQIRHKLRTISYLVKNWFYLIQRNEAEKKDYNCVKIHKNEELFDCFFNYATKTKLLDPEYTFDFYKPLESKQVNKIIENISQINKVSLEPFELFFCNDVYKRSEDIIKMSDAKLKKNIAPDDKYKLERAREIAKFCLKLKNDGFNENFAKQIAIHRLKMSQSGVFSGIPKMLINRGNDIISEDGENFGNIRKPGGVTERFATYMKENGGNLILLEAFRSHNAYSCWCPLAIAVKEFLVNQRDISSTWNTFFHDDRFLSDKKKSLPLTKKFSTSMRISKDFGGKNGRNILLENFKKLNFEFWEKYYFERKRHVHSLDLLIKSPANKSFLNGNFEIFDKTFIISYAFNQELLTRINFENKSQDSLTCYRYITPEAMQKSFLAYDDIENKSLNKGKLINEAAFICMRFQNNTPWRKWEENRLFLVECEVPIHLIFQTFFPDAIFHSFSIKSLDYVKELLVIPSNLEVTVLYSPQK
ncbi:MAG: hypothetical protein LBI55_02125 [Oscillospiraceae bacterium]|jgi:hypothetical protein|nr:hypothetical protein [Oscillospiraceae bacterium]